MNIHKDTFRRIDELGDQAGAYQPTFEFEEKFIDPSHRFYAECPVNEQFQLQLSHRFWNKWVVKGYLLREDALKLYEMAYFAQGDILELGSYRGLSTCILSQANRNSSYRKRIVTVDLSPKSVLFTILNLYTMGLKRNLSIQWAEAAQAIRQFARKQRKFSFVFIDHAHNYEPVFAVCQELKTVVAKGGFCLFHDFNVPENKDAGNSDFKVYQAVEAGLKAGDFEFYGIYGCSALYRAL